MIDKINTKIEEEIDKIVKIQDLTVEQLKNLVDIKNSLETNGLLKESIDSMAILCKNDLEKGEE